MGKLFGIRKSSSGDIMGKSKINKDFDDVETMILSEAANIKKQLNDAGIETSRAICSFPKEDGTVATYEVNLDSMSLKPVDIKSIGLTEDEYDILTGKMDNDGMDIDEIADSYHDHETIKNINPIRSLSVAERALLDLIGEL